MKKPCEKCHKPIKKNEWHFAVDEFKDGKLVETKYIHKNCQDDFDEKLNKVISERNMLEKAGNMLHVARGMLDRMGVPKEPETVVTVP